MNIPIQVLEAFVIVVVSGSGSRTRDLGKGSTTEPHLFLPPLHPLPSHDQRRGVSLSYLGCLWILLFCSRGRLCPCNPPTSASWRTQIIHLQHQALLKINSLFSVLWSVYLRIELTSDYSLIVEEFQTSITTVLFFFFCFPAAIHKGFSFSHLSQHWFATFPLQPHPHGWGVVPS